MSRLSPKAIHVDLDGTLANSLDVMRVAYREFLSLHGVHGSDDEFNRLNGPPLAEVIRRLKAVHALAEDELVLHDRYTSMVDEAYKSIEAHYGAADLLTKARRNDCAVCVVTSNSRARTCAWLLQSQLAEYISFVIAAEDVRIGKPAPEPYLLAAKLTGRPISAAVAVEDSLLGAQSASAAGLRTYVVCRESLSADWPTSVVPIASLHHLADQLW